MTGPTTLRGFTLLELLVAATISVGITTLMLSTTAGVLDLWRKTQAAQTEATAARQVFELLEQDLHAAIHRRDEVRWLAMDVIDAPSGLANHGWLVAPTRMKPANGGSLRLLPTAASGDERRIVDARFGLSGCWLRLVTANIESGGTLPVVVAYQIARRPITGDPVASNRSPVRYSLYRTAVANTDTLANGCNVNATAYGSTDNNPFSALSSAYRNPRNVTNPSHANLLASNVVDFGLWFYVRNPDGSLGLIYPSTSTDVSTSRFPEVADVMVRILSDEGAALIEAMESNRLSPRPPIYATDADWWWGVVNANSRVFARRIELKAGAL